MQVLRRIGLSAVEELESALPTADEVTQTRIKEVLDSMHLDSVKRFTRFERLNNDSLLRMLVYVGQIMMEHGPTSWRGMERLLTDGTLTLDGIENDFPTGESSLRVGIKRLENELGFRLSNRRPGKKGGLTLEAQGLLGEVRQYLAFKQERRGPTNSG